MKSLPIGTQTNSDFIKSHQNFFFQNDEDDQLFLELNNKFFLHIVTNISQNILVEFSKFEKTDILQYSYRMKV